jgi:hypothetical protein
MSARTLDMPHALLLVRAEKVVSCMSTSCLFTLITMCFLLCTYLYSLTPHTVVFDSINIVTLCTDGLALLCLLYPIYVAYMDHQGMALRTAFSHTDLLLVLFALLVQVGMAVTLALWWTFPASEASQILFMVLLGLAALALGAAIAIVVSRYLRWKMSI